MCHLPWHALTGAELETEADLEPRCPKEASYWLHQISVHHHLFKLNFYFDSNAFLKCYLFFGFCFSVKLDPFSWSGELLHPTWIADISGPELLFSSGNTWQAKMKSFLSVLILSA